MVFAYTPASVTTIVLGILIAAAPMAASGPATRDPSFLVEDLRIPAAYPGIELFLRSKRLRGLSTFRAERALLFVS